MGNYHSFGHNKFIPENFKETFVTILFSNPLAGGDNKYSAVIKELLQVENEIFNDKAPYHQINFPEKGGITAYFSRNMVAADLELVNQFLVSQSVDVLNTRAFKKESKFVITVGSISTEGTKLGIEF